MWPGKNTKAGDFGLTFTDFHTKKKKIKEFCMNFYVPFFKVVHKPQEKKIIALKQAHQSELSFFFQNTHTERESEKDIHVFFLRGQSATWYKCTNIKYIQISFLSRKSVLDIAQNLAIHSQCMIENTLIDSSVPCNIQFANVQPKITNFFFWNRNAMLLMGLKMPSFSIGYLYRSLFHLRENFWKTFLFGQLQMNKLTQSYCF